MDGKKPGKSKLRKAFIAVVAVFGMGSTTGVLESLDKDPMTDTQKITTFKQGATDQYGYNISPIDQLWKASLYLKSGDGLTQDIIESAGKGDSWRTTVLLEHGLSPYSIAAEKGLEEAALRGHADVVNVLLKAGVNPSGQDGAALLAAVRGHNDSIAYLLMERGVSGSSQNSEALITAAAQGNVSMIDALIAHGADATSRDSAALRYAAILGNENAIASLLLHGASATADDSAAMRSAAEAGNLAVVKQLVAAGADVSAADGVSLVHAVTSGNVDLVQFILDQRTLTTTNYGYGVTTTYGSIVSPNTLNGAALTAAASSGNLEMARILIDAGANIDANGGNALLNAIYADNYNMASYLIFKGANVNTDNGAALNASVSLGNGMMTQLLMSNNADASLLRDQIKTSLNKPENADIKQVVQGQKLQKFEYYGYP